MRHKIHTDTMDYCSAIKQKNEILPFAATWTDMKGIVLSEVSHIAENKYSMI